MPTPFAEALKELGRTLPPREWEVIRLRYGLDDKEPIASEFSPSSVKRRISVEREFRTLEEVGEVYNLTRERIRQIEAKAFRQLRHPSRRGLIVAGIEAQLQNARPESLNFPDRTLRFVLEQSPGEFPHPERWLTLLGKVYSDIGALRSTESMIEEPRKWLAKDVQQNGGSMGTTTFADTLIDRGIAAEDVNRVMAGLYDTDSSYAWVDGCIVVPRYIEIARFVLRKAGTELHWKDIYERALGIDFGRELNPSVMYNAISANNNIFVYRRQGTYGLAEWGLSRRRWQKDIIADWFRRAGHNARADEIVSDLRGQEDEIGASSVAWYLADNPLFFEDLNGDYGLREWLPRPDAQRIDTPRSSRESKRSRERRGPDSGS